MELSVLKDIIISLCALGGLILGIYNMTKDKKKEEVTLTVKPISIHKMGDGKNYGHSEAEIQKSREFVTLGLKVINLSKFDISIVEAGFKVADSLDGERLVFPEAMILGEGLELPFRIPSRESITIAFKPEQLPPEGLREQLESVFVTTACELEFVGKSKVISDYKNV